MLGDHVERATAALVVAVDAADYLREHLCRLATSGDDVAVITVRGENVVIAAQCVARAHSGRFLTDVDMVVAADEAGLLSGEVNYLLFGAADQEHALQGLLQCRNG